MSANMDEETEAQELVLRIRKKFPAEAAKTDRWLVERLWKPQEVPHIWVEAFAERTSEAIRAKDAKLVKEQSEFMSVEYRQGSKVVRDMVNVSYVENIMWNLDGSAKTWAWKHLSQEVRQLYHAMWGTPHL